MGYFIIMFSDLILKRQCYYTLYYLLNFVTFIFFLVYVPHCNAVILKHIIIVFFNTSCIKISLLF